MSSHPGFGHHARFASSDDPENGNCVEAQSTLNRQNGRWIDKIAKRDRIFDRKQRHISPVGLTPLQLNLIFHKKKHFKNEVLSNASLEGAQRTPRPQSGR